MNVIKSLFIAAMSLGLVGTASVARAEEPAASIDEGVVAESDDALSSQPLDYRPYDWDDYRRRGGRGRCLDFCAKEYFQCERYDDRFRRFGYERDRFSRRNRCEREYNFCARRVCRRGGDHFDIR